MLMHSLKKEITHTQAQLKILQKNADSMKHLERLSIMLKEQIENDEEKHNINIELI